jgi:hypothetical protein
MIYMEDIRRGNTFTEDIDDLLLPLWTTLSFSEDDADDVVEMIEATVPPRTMLRSPPSVGATPTVTTRTLNHGGRDYKRNVSKEPKSPSRKPVNHISKPAQINDIIKDKALLARTTTQPSTLETRIACFSVASAPL